MLNRRSLIKLSGAAGIAAILPSATKANNNNASQGSFQFCLNTSTISDKKPGLVQYINIGSQAGYDGLELWMNDIKEYLERNSVQSLKALLTDNRIAVHNVISFTPWLVNDHSKRKAALAELEEEMKILFAIGCTRIAAPPAGVEKGEMPDWQTAGERYRTILELGKKYNVLPLLEFWGASGTLYSLGQALAIATAADHAEARILPDVYHMFRGGSGFEGLKLINGHVIDIIHFNDYPSSKPRLEQTDADRVYPGDGVAPIKQILASLKAMGGTKSLSLELFNRKYWEQNELEVAKTGLAKMKKLVAEM